MCRLLFNAKTLIKLSRVSLIKVSLKDEGHSNKECVFPGSHFINAKYTTTVHSATILSSRGLVFLQSKLSYFYHSNLKHTRPTLLQLHNKKHIFPKCLFTYHLPHYLRDITQVWRFSSYDNKLFSLFLHITLPCFTPILFGLAVYWAPINETSKSK